jgi:hypothetical protein
VKPGPKVGLRPVTFEPTVALNHQFDGWWVPNNQWGRELWLACVLVAAPVGFDVQGGDIEHCRWSLVRNFDRYRTYLEHLAEMYRLRGDLPNCYQCIWRLTELALYLNPELRPGRSVTRPSKLPLTPQVLPVAQESPFKAERSAADYSDDELLRIGENIPLAGEVARAELREREKRDVGTP